MDSTGKLFGEAGGDFDGEARLADSAGAGDGYEANAGARKKFTRSGGFPFAADESVAGDGNRRSADFDLARRRFLKAVANRAKVAREFTRCGETARRIFFQTALDSPAERSGSIALCRDDRLVALVHDGAG